MSCNYRNKEKVKNVQNEVIFIQSSVVKIVSIHLW